MKKQTIDFEITDKDTNESLSDRIKKLCSNMFWNLPVGKYTMTIGKPQRTLKQNSCIHALFPDLAVELHGIGVEYKMGKLTIPWDEASAKEFFVYAFNDGRRTSKSTTKELAHAVDKCLKAINSSGGQLAIRNDDLNNLLSQER